MLFFYPTEPRLKSPAISMIYTRRDKY